MTAFRRVFIIMFFWGVAATAHAQSMAEYTFTRVHPPLLKDFGGDVIAIPESQRTEHVGTTSWQYQAGPFPAKNHRFTEIHHLERYRRWVITEPPVHYSQAQTHQVTTVTGYSKTQRETMESSLSLSLTAGGTSGISASAKEDLKITNETIAEWREETTTTITSTFNENTTYIKWSLLDTIRHTKTNIGERLDAAGNTIEKLTEVAEEFLDIIFSVYNDKMADPQAEAFATAVEALKRPGIAQQLLSAKSVPARKLVPGEK